jgi:hypothetical protein
MGKHRGLKLGDRTFRTSRSLRKREKMKAKRDERYKFEGNAKGHEQAAMLDRSLTVR